MNFFYTYTFFLVVIEFFKFKLIHKFYFSVEPAQVTTSRPRVIEDRPFTFVDMQAEMNRRMKVFEMSFQERFDALLSK